MWEMVRYVHFDVPHVYPVREEQASHRKPRCEGARVVSVRAMSRSTRPHEGAQSIAALEYTYTHVHARHKTEGVSHIARVLTYRQLVLLRPHGLLLVLHHVDHLQQQRERRAAHRHTARETRNRRVCESVSECVWSSIGGRDHLHRF